MVELQSAVGPPWEIPSEFQADMDELRALNESAQRDPRLEPVYLARLENTLERLSPKQARGFRAALLNERGMVYRRLATGNQLANMAIASYARRRPGAGHACSWWTAADSTSQGSSSTCICPPSCTGAFTPQASHSCYPDPTARAPPNPSTHPNRAEPVPTCHRGFGPTTAGTRPGRRRPGATASRFPRPGPCPRRLGPGTR
jgi:hypothetical protein